jgi:hypothetical protein
MMADVKKIMKEVDLKRMSGRRVRRNRSMVEGIIASS